MADSNKIEITLTRERAPEFVPPSDDSAPTFASDFVPLIAAVKWAIDEELYQGTGNANTVADLRAAQAVLEGLADREWLARVLCCGHECNAVNACVGHDISPDRYAERYGCESGLVLKAANVLRAALLARAGGGNG